MHENTAEVLVVFFNAVITALVVFLEKAQDGFFQLAAAFAGDDFDIFGVFINGLVEHVAQGGFDGIVVGENAMKVQLQFHVNLFISGLLRGAFGAPRNDVL